MCLKPLVPRLGETAGWLARAKSPFCANAGQLRHRKCLYSSCSAGSNHVVSSWNACASFKRAEGKTRLPSSARHICDLSNSVIQEDKAALANSELDQLPSQARYSGTLGPNQIRLVTLAPRFQRLNSELQVEHQQQRQQFPSASEYPWYTQAWTHSHGKNQTVPRFRIDVFDFDKAPPYEALSYTWDDFQRTTLLLDPRPLMVTGNLALALQELQLDDKPRLLWIDALCINQHDNDEMSNQIRMMKDIYSRARRSIMWLGAADESTGLAFRSFARRAKEWDGNTLRPPAAIPSSRCDKDEVAAVLKLMQNPYFTRVWIIQEIVVSRAVTVACGRFRMALDALFSGAYWYAYSLPKFSDDGGVTGTIGQMMIFDGLDPWRRAFHSTARRRSSSESLRLEHALVTTRNCSATDAKDRVYSLLGFTNNINSDNFPIDYSASVADVYSRATKAIIRSGYVDVLSSVQRLPNSSSDLPSWVPDWRVPWDSVPLAARKWFYNVSARSRPSSSRRYMCNDGGGRDEEEEEEEELHKLRMEGHLVDVVAHVFDPWEELGRQDVSRFWFGEVQIQQILRKYGLRGWYPLTREPMERACLRTMLADLLPGFRRWERRPTLDWRRFVRWAFPDKWYDGEAACGSFSEAMPLTVRSEIMHNIKDFLHHRKLFVTSGGFIGLGPAMTQRKDEVAILLGASVPFVGRDRRDGTWELLGECYVHGIMDGEMISAIADTKPDVFTIT